MNHSLPVQGDRPRRRDALRQLIHPRQFKGSIALTQQPSLRNSALSGVQAALTSVIALPMVYLSPWSHLIGFASLGALVALFGRFAPTGQRRKIVFQCGVVQTVSVFLMSAAVWLGAPQWAQLGLLALACGALLFIAATARFGAPGPLLFVFAVGASMGTDLTLTDVLERSAATMTVAALAWIICAASETLRHKPTPARAFPEEPLRPISHRLIGALRSALGAGLAICVSQLFGADHPVWAAMGALAVMQGAHLHITMDRALQRLAGTLIGALLAWALLIQHPSVWPVIAALMVLQILTEMVIGYNYALGQIFVTPMALLMTYLAAGQTIGPEMVPERVFDTLIGAAVGVIASVILSSMDDRRFLAQRHHGRA